MKKMLTLAGALVFMATNALAGAKCESAKNYLEKNKTELATLFKAKARQKKGMKHNLHGIDRLKAQSLTKITDLEAAIEKKEEMRCSRLQQSLESSVTRVKAGQ